MYKSPKSLLDVVSTNNIVHNVLDHAKHLIELESILNLHLPKIAKNKCKIASFKERVLLLIVPSANIRTRLYFDQQQLITKLKNHVEFITLFEIYIKVKPLNESPETSKLPILTISKQAAKNIRRGINFIKYKKLKIAFEQIAQRAQ